MVKWLRGRKSKKELKPRTGRTKIKNFRLVSTLPFWAVKRKRRGTKYVRSTDTLTFQSRRKLKRIDYNVISSREWNKALDESLRENDNLMRILARL
jgi:uncharacterized membrane protein